MECRTNIIFDEGDTRGTTRKVLPQGSRAKWKERNWILVTLLEPLDQAIPEGLPLGCSDTDTNKFPFLRSQFSTTCG